MSLEALVERCLSACRAPTWLERTNETCDAISEELSVAVRCRFLDLADGQLKEVYPTVSGSAAVPYDVYLATHESADGSDVVHIPLSEGRYPVGDLEISTGVVELDETARRVLRSAVSPLVTAYSLKKTTTFYRKIVQPLDFELDFDGFLEELGDLLLSASGMQFVALRNLRDARLELVDAWGFAKSIHQQHLSWTVDQYDAFHLAAEGLIQDVQDVLGTQYESLRSVPGLADIRSFIVAPVSVGGDIYGVLSCGASCPYEYTGVDRLRMEALANSVGVALANYRNVHGNVLSLQDVEELSITATTAEVAHAARHEVRALADTARTWARQVYKTKPGKTRDEFYERLDRVLLDIDPAIDKIRIASRPIRYEKTTRGLVAEFRRVIDLMEGRLEEERITTICNDADVEVQIIEDLFRQVYLHLVLNSIDAFRGRGVGTRQPLKTGRRIRLDVERVTADRVVLKYSDNAIGIQDRQVRVRYEPDDEDEAELPRIIRDRARDTKEAVEALPIEQRIFKPNVSSKGRAGSGWGLYLVRRILDEHKGSIDLTDYTNGVTFRISLPRVDSV